MIPINMRITPGINVPSSSTSGNLNAQYNGEAVNTTMIA